MCSTVKVCEASHTGHRPISSTLLVKWVVKLKLIVLIRDENCPDVNLLWCLQPGDHVGGG